MTTVEVSESASEDNCVEVSKMVAIGSGASRRVRDYMLTRYACYLIAMNGDPRKQEIAFAQSHFALSTRRNELIKHCIEEHNLRGTYPLHRTDKQTIVLPPSLARASAVPRSRENHLLLSRPPASHRVDARCLAGPPLRRRRAGLCWQPP